MPSPGRPIRPHDGGQTTEEPPALVALKGRRRGRPGLGSAPAEVVPIRLDPELKNAVDPRAEAEHITTSEITRKALRRYLDVS